MSESEFSKIDLEESIEGYLQYAIGTAVLHVPESTQFVHRRDLSTQAPEIVKFAEVAMHNGAKQMIQRCNPSELRQNFSSLEDRYDLALPNLRFTIKEAFKDSTIRDRLNAVSPALFVVQPAAMCSRSLYRYICKGRTDKIRTDDLMGGMSLDPNLEPLVIGKNLTEQPLAETEFTSQIAKEVAELGDV